MFATFLAVVIVNVSYKINNSLSWFMIETVFFSEEYLQTEC